MIRGKSLHSLLSAWLKSLYQSNLFMKGKGADVSLHLIFQLILMSLFLINIGQIQKKSIELFEKVIFPYLKQVKGSLKYPKEQMSFIIMKIFKGQDNDVIYGICQNHFCQALIVPHNLTNRFQPLDITVNKQAKSFIWNEYNEWFHCLKSAQIRENMDRKKLCVWTLFTQSSPCGFHSNLGKLYSLQMFNMSSFYWTKRNAWKINLGAIQLFVSSKRNYS